MEKIWPLREKFGRLILKNNKRTIRYKVWLCLEKGIEEENFYDDSAVCLPELMGDFATEEEALERFREIVTGIQHSI